MSDNDDHEVVDERTSLVHQQQSDEEQQAAFESRPKASRHRFLHRNLPYFQSRNKLPIVNRHSWDHRGLLLVLFSQDWFHVFLRLPTPLSLLILIIIWTVLILAFAGFYVAVHNQNPRVECGLGDEFSYGPAFAFSLQTTTTVGYGLPGSTNAFFENCPSLQVTIYFQMVLSMMFNAFLLAFLFARLSRSETRGAQVLFSEKAILRRNPEGKWLLEMHVYDADAAYPVVEAHVRLYAVHRKNLRLQYMRILRPNDELGGTLYTSVPTAVTHHVDAFSALCPKASKPSTVIDGHGLVLREVDSATESRDGHVCPMCSEMYGTHERLHKHIRYNQLTESHDSVPMEGSHQEVDVESLEVPSDDWDPDELRRHLADFEILCVVEGIDPLTSGTFQALHSYTDDDIVFGGFFATCVTGPNDKGKFEVDLDRFNSIVQECAV